MKKSNYKKLGDLRGRRKDKAQIKQAKKKVRVEVVELKEEYISPWSVYRAWWGKGVE